MSASQAGSFNIQEFADAGAPLVGGRLYTYAFGTTTQKTAYTDHAGTVPHAYTSDGIGGQYIALNARGELSAPLYLVDGSYDLALKTAAGATVWTRRADPVWDIVNDLSSGTGTELIGFMQSGSGAIPRTAQDKLRDVISSADFGAAGDGISNDRNALSYADTRASSEGFTLAKGVYRVSSNLTISSAVKFSPGAVLKPDSGVTVTLLSPFSANLGQIFDLSSGGLIALPMSIDEVWANWWGAKGDMVKVDNEVPINQAIAALGVIVSGVFGGNVRLARGDYYVSGTINLTDEVSLKGVSKQYPVLFAYPGAFAPGSNMVYATNGTSSMFNSRLENLRINASAQSNINNVVHSNAWQEKCGMRNVLIENFIQNGFYWDIGYGGAAELCLSDIEVWAAASATATSSCVKVYATSLTVAWLSLSVLRATLAGATPNQPVVGLNLDGRVIANVTSVHGEQMASLILLQGAACLTGSGITPTGGSDVTNVINCSSTWVGSINATMVKKAGAAKLIADANRAYNLSNIQPFDDHLVWPPSPSRAIASGLITGGGTPVFNWQAGDIQMTVANISAGRQRITLSVSTPGYLYFDVLAVASDAGGLYASVENFGANSFDVYTKTSAGVATNSASMTVKVFHRP